MSAEPQYICRGDLLIWDSYIPDGDGYDVNGMDSKEPCLCLAKARAGRATGRAWVIGLSVAWKYVEPDGHATTELKDQISWNIGNAIGVGDTLQARSNIIGAIEDYIPQLLQAYDFEVVREERHGAGVPTGEIMVFNDGILLGGTEIIH